MDRLKLSDISSEDFRESKEYGRDFIEHAGFSLDDFISAVKKGASDIGKKAKKASDDVKKSISKAKHQANSKTSGKGKKDREWKKHKWVARKRNKDGKWIYDYGNGFPDEQNVGYKRNLEDELRIAKEQGISEDSLDNLDDLRYLSKAQKIANMIVSSPTKDLVQLTKESLGINEAIIATKKAEQIKENSQVDKATGLHLKSKNTSKEDDLKSTNPAYTFPDGGGKYNCYACSMAYDLRRRGFEVTAKEDQNGASAYAVQKSYKNADPTFIYTDDPSQIKIKDDKYVNKDLTRQVTRELSKEPDGSRGIMMLTWANGTGGHAVNYEIENGKPYIYDSQVSEKMEISEYTDESISAAYFRTDNLEPDYDRIKKVVD